MGYVQLYNQQYRNMRSNKLTLCSRVTLSCWNVCICMIIWWSTPQMEIGQNSFLLIGIDGDWPIMISIQNGVYGISIHVYIYISSTIWVGYLDLSENIPPRLFEYGKLWNYETNSTSKIDKSCLCTDLRSPDPSAANHRRPTGFRQHGYRDIFRIFVSWAPNFDPLPTWNCSIIPQRFCRLPELKLLHLVF